MSDGPKIDLAVAMREKSLNYSKNLVYYLETKCRFEQIIYNLREMAVKLIKVSGLLASITMAVSLSGYGTGGSIYRTDKTILLRQKSNVLKGRLSEFSFFSVNEISSQSSVLHLTYESHRDAATLPRTRSERLPTHFRRGIHCQAGNTSATVSSLYVPYLSRSCRPMHAPGDWRPLMSARPCVDPQKKMHQAYAQISAKQHYAVKGFQLFEDEDTAREASAKARRSDRKKRMNIWREGIRAAAKSVIQAAPTGHRSADKFAASSRAA